MNRQVLRLLSQQHSIFLPLAEILIQVHLSVVPETANLKKLNATLTLI